MPNTPTITASPVETIVVSNAVSISFSILPTTHEYLNDYLRLSALAYLLNVIYLSKPTARIPSEKLESEPEALSAPDAKALK